MARAKKRELAQSVLGFKARGDTASGFWSVPYRVYYKPPWDFTNILNVKLLLLRTMLAPSAWGFTLPMSTIIIWQCRLWVNNGLNSCCSILPTVTSYHPLLLKQPTKTHKASHQTWRQARTTALSVPHLHCRLLPGEMGTRSTACPCSPALYGCKQGKLGL